MFFFALVLASLSDGPRIVKFDFNNTETINGNLWVVFIVPTLLFLVLGYFVIIKKREPMH